MGILNVVESGREDFPGRHLLAFGNESVYSMRERASIRFRIGRGCLSFPR